MSKEPFKCVKKRRETGINWCDEMRVYRFAPTFFSRFHKIKHEFGIGDTGQFYFESDNRSSLPLEGNVKMGSKLKPFNGKKIFEWISENASDKVLIHCRRSYGGGMTGFSMDDDFYMNVYFSSVEDATAFKLWWL